MVPTTSNSSALLLFSIVKKSLLISVAVFQCNSTIPELGTPSKLTNSIGKGPGDELITPLLFGPVPDTPLEDPGQPEQLEPPVPGAVVLVTLTVGCAEENITTPSPPPPPPP